MLKIGFVFLILALVLTVAMQPANASVLRQSSQIGIFGEVVNVTGDHPRAVAGEIDITLNTAKGPVEITANPGTVIRVPGMEQPSVEDIPLGSPVAVLASNGQAASILVKPVRPVRSRHFTGIVTGVGEDGIVEIEDDRGRKISAPLADGPSVLKPGYMVTAVLDQDLNSGAILITGLDQALDNLKRLQAALERAEKDPATGKLAALRQRLNENGDRHLTMAQNVLNRTGPSRQGQLKERFDAAQNAYGQGMSRFRAGRPSATVSGIVTSIDQQRKLLMVQPARSALVQVIIDGDTAIKFQGRDIPFSRLDVANRVQVRYGLEFRVASRVSVSAGATLDKTAAKVLLATRDPGEVTGTVLDIERFPGELPHITLRDKESQHTVTLNMSQESVVLRNGAPSAVNRDLLDTEVTAIFYPDSLELIELDSQAADGENSPIRGVIHRFVAKNLPGNLSILTRDGAVRTFSRTGETVVRRNGRQVSINEVRLGDLVRANTRILLASGDAAPVLEVLSLSSPPLAPIHGTITGITDAGQGSMRATITTNKLDIVDVLVDADTQVVQKGKSIGLDGLALGQRIVNGAYHPISREAARLTVQPPRAARISGEITLVEEYLSAVTIQPRQGDPVILIFPQNENPVITRQNKRGLKLSDLKAGDRVRAAFYDPATNRVLRIVLAPKPDLDY
ncbi:MAG: hypothetical protein CMJ45_00065 [Planctomyces sp.]|jgi:hypothetical protein|nr:hypothetical protein [Planctomyces sp.]